MRCFLSFSLLNTAASTYCTHHDEHVPWTAVPGRGGGHGPPKSMERRSPTLVRRRSDPSGCKWHRRRLRGGAGRRMPQSATLLPCDMQLVCSQVAFRRTWVDNTTGRLLHNGAGLLLRGVNRHEHDQWRGKALDEGGMWRDGCLIKRLNFNAVRCSHYPTHDRWYGEQYLSCLCAAGGACDTLSSACY